MRRNYFRLLEGVLFSLPMLFASCGNGDNALEEIINGGGSGSGGGGSESAETYLKWDDGTQTLVATELPDAPKMAASTTTWSGTYIVDEDIEITGDVTLGGDVDLIIKDGFTLSLASDKKINYTTTEGYKLNIYSQSNGDGAGKLTVSTTTDGFYPILINGTLNIHSGIVNSTSTGAGNEGIFAKILNIYGGKVVVTTTGAGIMAGDLYIYNGADVKATSSGADGIQAYNTSLTISGDETKVSATGSTHGICGTGGSMTVTINGGTIFGKATGDGATDYGIEGIISYKGGVVEGEGGTNALSFGFGGQFYNNSGAAINVGTKSNPADAWTSTPLNNGYSITAFNKYMIMPMP